MQANTALGLFLGIVICFSCSELLGQRKDKETAAKKKTRKEQAQTTIKGAYEKSTERVVEKTKKPQEVSWEGGKINSTLPSKAADLKPDKKNISQNKQASPRKNKTKDAKEQYLDSLLRVSDLIKQQETAMGKASKGNSPAQVHSEKTKRQLEDTIDRYFPARKFLLLAQKKEEISPSDFAALLTNKKETEGSKNFPSSEGDAKSAMTDNAKEESIKEAGSFRLPKEHLATLKTLEARQINGLPKGILDSLRKVALKKNAIRMKERKPSKSELHNKIQEKGKIRHRFFFEGILGGFSQDFSAFQFSPALGFKVFRTYSIAIGPMLSVGRRANRWSASCDVRVFVKKELFKQRCYIQAEDMMHPYSLERGFSIAQRFYAGAGYVLHIGRMTSLNVMGLYQIGGERSQPFVFRIGLSIVNK